MGVFVLFCLGTIFQAHQASDSSPQSVFKYAVEYSIRVRESSWLGTHNLNLEVDLPSSPSLSPEVNFPAMTHVVGARKTTTSHRTAQRSSTQRQTWSLCGSRSRGCGIASPRDMIRFSRSRSQDICVSGSGAFCFTRRCGVSMILGRWERGEGGM